MEYKDLFKLANQNNKASKKFFVKIIIGATVIFTFLICVLSVWLYYKQYQAKYEKKYRESCYIYSELNKTNKYELANKKLELVDLIFDSVGNVMELGKVEIVIDGQAYTPHKIYVSDNSKYYDLYSDLSEFKLRKDTAFVDEKYLIEGNNIFTDGTILIDDYLLSVLGIKDIKSVINKKINVIYDNKIVLENYNIVGVFDVTMYDEVECKDYHDYHFEHMYINVKADEKYSTYGNNRYYFASYNDLMKSYEYSADFIFGGSNADTTEYDSFIPIAAYEICISSWFMSSVGKGILLLILIISIAIIYSIYYYFLAYFDRNKNYINMLHNIGMTWKDIKRLHNIELLEIVGISIGSAFYIAIILLSCFAYVTKKYLAIAYSINFINIIFALTIGVTIMFIVKLLAYKSSYGKNQI